MMFLLRMNRLGIMHRRRLGLFGLRVTERLDWEETVTDGNKEVR